MSLAPFWDRVDPALLPMLSLADGAGRGLGSPTPPNGPSRQPCPQPTPTSLSSPLSSPRQACAPSHSVKCGCVEALSPSLPPPLTVKRATGSNTQHLIHGFLVSNPEGFVRETQVVCFPWVFVSLHRIKKPAMESCFFSVL